MDKKLTLGSLFDGSGGFPLGGLISGIIPVWASEIEPFPIRVTTKRMPFMKHYGDVSNLNGADLPPVDIITFGSPCQDMSVAGRRAGLDGSRSNLFYEAVRIVREMRNATNGDKPRYIVWENVPGAFSSNGGEDFKAVLDTIRRVKEAEADTPRPARWPNAGCILADDHSIAWRVFDAQYWGVPQRRKRIYLVADFAGQCAGKILFESEGLSGYTPQGFRSWQGIAGTAEEGAGAAGRTVCMNDQGGIRIDITEDITATLRAEAHHPPAVMEAAGFCTEHSAKSRSIGFEEDTSPTLRAGTVPAAVYENHGQDTRYTGPVEVSPTVMSTYGTGGNNQPFVVETPKTLKIRCGCDGGGKGPLIQDDRSATLSCHNDQTLFVPESAGISAGNSNGIQADDSFAFDAADCRTVSFGIDCTTYSRGQDTGVTLCIDTEIELPEPARGLGSEAHPVYSTSKNSYHTGAEEGIANTLVATDYKDPPIVSEGSCYIVRRLTPAECARLQGFPDWWCEGLGIEAPDEKEIDFWREVFETHRRSTGCVSRPKTNAQIVKWLKDPRTDSAEYKLWGNGVALPCVCFVLAGIVYCDQFVD